MIRPRRQWDSARPKTQQRPSGSAQYTNAAKKHPTHASITRAENFVVYCPITAWPTSMSWRSHRWKRFCGGVQYAPPLGNPGSELHLFLSSPPISARKLRILSSSRRFSASSLPRPVCGCTRCGLTLDISSKPRRCTFHPSLSPYQSNLGYDFPVNQDIQPRKTALTRSEMAASTVICLSGAY